MSPEELKAKNVRFVEAVLNNKELNRMEEFLAPEYVLHNNTPPIEGPEGFRQAMNGMQTSFPDIHFTVEEFIVAGDKTISRWSMTGTHLAPWWDVAPTGKAINTTGLTMSRVNPEGKVVEEWIQWGIHSLLEQIRYVPDYSRVPATT
ncbi:MAG: ester cyclase [Chloroflexi bacterium]|jgi:predicted ester cyclase|nr:ester cyclase [Chloroflexota bacterium]